VTHLLDANACVTYIRGKSLLLRARITAAPTGTVALCSPVLAELYDGAEQAKDPVAEHARVDAFAAPYPVLSFDAAAAREYARVRHALRRAGTPIGHHDYLIAAVALANNLKLVTHNTQHFSRVPGLDIEDWEIP
jgi:tRNA(fMet)-specific endonuclease VapC